MTARVKNCPACGVDVDRAARQAAEAARRRTALRNEINERLAEPGGWYQMVQSGASGATLTRVRYAPARIKTSTLERYAQLARESMR